jgi:hypothetical protein
LGTRVVGRVRSAAGLALFAKTLLVLSHPRGGRRAVGVEGIEPSASTV